MFVNDICEQNQKLLKNTDVILASYPRSGNTWMRLLLSDIILQSQGFKTQLGGNFIPDIYKEGLDIWSRDPRVKKVPLRIIKSHEFYDTRYANSIYLFRKPADALCSFYYYLLGYPEHREALQKQGIDDFCKVKVEQWRTHVESYIEAKEIKSDKVLFISYESLKEKPEIILRKTTRDFLGLNITSRMCQIAVENQNFEGLQRIQKLEDTSKLGFWEAGGYQDFFRKGKVNSSKDEIAQSTIDFIEANAMAIYNLALSIEKLDFQKESNQGMAMIKDKIEDLVSLGKESSLALKLNGLLSHRNETAVSQVQIDHQSELHKLQLQQVQEQLQQLQAENKQVKTELEQSQSQLHQTQGEAQQYQSQLHVAHEELEQHKALLNQTQGEAEQYQSQLHQTQGELQQYQSQLHQTQEVLEQFQDQMQEAETLLQEYQGQLHQTQGELEQSQSQLHQTQGELEQSQSQLHQTQGELEQSQSQLHQTQEVLEQSQSQLHQTQEVLEQSQSQLHQTQGELEQSQSQLHQTQGELEQSQSQLHQTQGELEQSQSQLHQTQGELEQSQSQLHQTQGELEQYSEHLAQTEKILEQYQFQLQQTRIELQKDKSLLYHQDWELERSHFQHHQTQAQLAGEKSQTEKIKDELHQIKAELEKLKVNFYVTQTELVRVQVLQEYIITQVQLDNALHYKLLVWDAWYAYQNGDLNKMQQYLDDSLKFTSVSRTESLLKWLESFCRFSRENGHHFDTYVLTNSQEWKQLTQGRYSISQS